MKTLCYVIPGNPVTKKNSPRIVTNKTTGKAFPLPSKQYENYEAGALMVLKPSRPKAPIGAPVNIRVRYYMQTLRAVDLVNLLEATDDILVRAGVLQDDNNRIVAGHDGSRVYLDREHPRAEITITAVDEWW